MLSLPDEADSLAFLGERLGRGRREILLSDDQLRPRIECDPVPGVRAEIGDRSDATARGPLVIADGGVWLGEMDLLEVRIVNAPVAEDTAGGVAGQEVGRPDEAGYKDVVGRS